MKENTLKNPARREALKLAGVGGAALLLGGTSAQAGATGPSKKKISKTHPLRIVIIGGGMAGTMLAYRLSRAVTWPEITVFEPQRYSAWYQPGLALVGAGIWYEGEIRAERREYIPDSKHVHWLDRTVTAVDPEKRIVTDSEGKTTPYDYLIVASGARLDFGAVEGLEGVIDTMHSPMEREDWMDDPAIGSVYYLHGATQLPEQFDALADRAAKSDEKKLKVIFSQPGVTIKSPGAAKSILSALLDKLEKEGVRDRVEILFVSGDGRLSANDAYDKLYRKMLEKEGVAFAKKQVVAVDRQARTARFDDGSESAYDFLHIAPPMRVDTLFVNAGLTDDKGWIAVDEATLQHRKYSSVFAIGDAAGISALKTGSAIVDQAKTVVDAMRAQDEGRKTKTRYDGYGCDTVLCVGAEKALYESYNRSGKPEALFGFDALKCSRAYWYVDTRLLKPYVMEIAMRGWA